MQQRKQTEKRRRKEEPPSPHWTLAQLGRPQAQSATPITPTPRNPNPQIPHYPLPRFPTFSLVSPSRPIQSGSSVHRRRLEHPPPLTTPAAAGPPPRRTPPPASSQAPPPTRLDEEGLDPAPPNAPRRRPSPPDCLVPASPSRNSLPELDIVVVAPLLRPFPERAFAHLQGYVSPLLFPSSSLADPPSRPHAHTRRPCRSRSLHTAPDHARARRRRCPLLHPRVACAPDLP